MQNASKYIRLALLGALVILIIIFFNDIARYYLSAENIVRSAGAGAPFIYMLLMIIAILLAPIPASPLAISAGIIFGPWLGMVYTLIGATIGALLAFLLARFFLHDWVQAWAAKHALYKKFEGKDGRSVAYLVFVTRLMPQISFDIVSYMAGLTNISLLYFALATFLGMIPIVFLLSFFGAAIAPYTRPMLAILFTLFIGYAIYKIYSIRNR